MECFDVQKTLSSSLQNVKYQKIITLVVVTEFNRVRKAQHEEYVKQFLFRMNVVMLLIKLEQKIF